MKFGCLVVFGAAVVTTFVGCKSGVKPCAAPLACPTSCQTSSDCSAGQLCNGGSCSAPLPTVGVHVLCGLDVGCPSGDHCDLGACSHDCVKDLDCSGGTICDARGRCTSSAQAGEAPSPAPPTASGSGSAVLGVDAGNVAFYNIDAPQTITFVNSGGAPLSFRLLSDKPWLDAQPGTGTVAPGASQAVTLVVRPAQASGDTRASLTLFTNGGTTTFPVAIPFQMHALYRGQLTITQPQAMGTRELSLYLAEQADGTLTGVVDDANSAAFAFPAAVQGTANPDAGVDFTFVLPAAYGSPVNPSYQLALLRTVHISGPYPGLGPLTGSYQEQIEGLLSPDAGPVLIGGTLVLNAQPATTFPVPRAATVTLSEPTYPEPTLPASCFSTCPGDCSTDLTAGAAYLAAAFPIYAAYGDAGYAAVSQCIAGVNSTGCFNPTDLACAQARFQRAVANGDTGPCGNVPNCAVRGLLDSFKGVHAWQMLSGNQLLSNAHVIDGTTTLANQEAALAAAETQLTHAALSNQNGNPFVRASLDPFFVRWLSRMNYHYFEGAPAALTPSDLLHPQPPFQVSPWADLEDIATALSQQLVATLGHVNARQRLDGNNTASLREASTATASGHISLALVMTLLQRLHAPGPFFPSSAAAAAMSALSERTRELASGFNPVGLPEQYIAYTYNPNQGNLSNNFLSQLADFRGNYLPTVTGAYQTAMNAQRTYDTDQTALSQEMVNQTNTYAQQVVAACGGSIQDLAGALNNCGQVTGAVYEAHLEILSANDRVQLAVQAIDQLYKGIQIEENQAAQVAQVHTVQANLVLGDGQQINVLNEQESVLKDLQIAADVALHAVSNSLTSFGGSLAAGIVAAVVDIGVNEGTSDIERQKNNIATIQAAQVEYNVAQQTLIESAARIKTSLLQIPSLRINVDLATIDISRAAARMKAAAQSALDAKALHDQASGYIQTDPRGDPSFRVYRDHTIIAAESLMQDAMRQLFITTRSLEYELNASYAGSSQLFGLSVPSDLQAYADQLSTTYSDYVASVGQTQPRLLTLSLRNDVFQLGQPLTDTTTGQVYSPQDRFHRLLADPRNRDGAGNVKLQFTLSLSPDTTLFNANFCSDRIDNIRVSAIGATLGATAPEIVIAERGTAYLRSCTTKTQAGDYELVEYGQDTLGLRRAIIQCGVNLSGPNDPLAPPPDVELYGRPISANYELTIDVHSPANSTLDLTQLDDIVLYVAHETRTVQ